jgi:hypothetical protein
MKYENIFSENNNDYLYKSKHEAEEIYYGFNIPSNYKIELNNKLINFNQKKFLISDKNILINEFGDELLVLNEKLQIVEDIIIKKIKDEFKIQINDKVGNISGLDNKLTKDIFYELASMNRFSNAIFIKLNNPEKKYPYELGIEKYPSNKELNNIYEKLPVGRYFNKLKIITDAISSQGAFSYNEA